MLETETTNLLWLTTRRSIGLIVLPFRSTKGTWERSCWRQGEGVCVCVCVWSAANESRAKIIRAYEE